MYGNYGFYDELNDVAYGDAAKKCGKILKDIEKKSAKRRKAKRSWYKDSLYRKISRLKSKYVKKDCENVVPNGAAAISPVLAQELMEAGVAAVQAEAQREKVPFLFAQPAASMLTARVRQFTPRRSMQLGPGATGPLVATTTGTPWGMWLLATGIFGAVWWRVRQQRQR